jgi:hypothetical protein
MISLRFLHSTVQVSGIVDSQHFETRGFSSYLQRHILAYNTPVLFSIEIAYR